MFQECDKVVSLGVFHVESFELQVFEVLPGELLEENLLVGCLGEETQVLQVLVAHHRQLLHQLLHVQLVEVLLTRDILLDQVLSLLESEGELLLQV